ncbi:hypothetical protein ODU73_002371 [Thermoclostridium stercorarium]|uniref:hypothetical protein n=1 Tax=Thermoclostridium stercorarium TaxID=1510 RepID=UPI0022494602|nr:hypothetical protein [Thermoclostridium stercorarium]UZQ85251.1 hypothetical protein ODU73_002371 [Thermoclostridium stercorarium]
MLSEKVLDELQSFIYKNFQSFKVSESVPYTVSEPFHQELENFIEENIKPSFSQTLMKFIEKRD